MAVALFPGPTIEAGVRGISQGGEEERDQLRPLNLSGDDELRGVR